MIKYNLDIKKINWFIYFQVKYKPQNILINIKILLKTKKLYEISIDLFYFSKYIIQI